MSAASKPKWRPRLAGILPMTINQADVIYLLSRKTFDDAQRAGWIKPRVLRPTGKGASPIYAVDDVRAVESRLLNGEYPEGNRQEARGSRNEGRSA